MEEKYKLYHGDCLQIMDKLIEEGVKVDMILTDPPFGTTACKWDIIIPFNRYIVVKEEEKEKILYKDEFMLKKFKEGINIKEAEKEWKENSKEGMWEKINKLIKPNGVICLFGSEPFSSSLRMSNIKHYKYDWVWNKGRGTDFLNAKRKPLSSYENISVFYLKQPIYNPQFWFSTPYDRGLVKHSKNKRECYGKMNDVICRSEDGRRYPLNIININKIKSGHKEKVHPTQKPVQLLEYLIKTYTNEGDLILDFTMGSGSTGVACLNTNRRFIGIELDEKYFNIAKDRIESGELNNRQRKLF